MLANFHLNRFLFNTRRAKKTIWNFFETRMIQKLFALVEQKASSYFS